MTISQSYQRLDIWLVENKFFKSRNSAAIQAGGIILNGEIERKISKKITSDDKVEIKKDHKVYVSRSARKLKYLLEKTNKNISDNVCLDLGASTGGFTQVLLEFGVGKVYAIDVGINQLDSFHKRKPQSYKYGKSRCQRFRQRSDIIRRFNKCRS